jgi:hypothetical protein
LRGISDRGRNARPTAPFLWPWTRGEDEKLRELALADAGTPAIANQLGQTIGAVQSRARRLNITLKRGKRRPAAL